MKKNRKIVIGIILVILSFAVFLTVRYYQKYVIHKNIDLLKSSDSKTRQDAVKNLVSVGEPAVEPLIFALQFDTTQAKSSFARFFAEKSHNKTIEGYAYSSEIESNNLKRGALQALSLIGDRRAIMPVITALKQNGGSIREEAFTTLVKLGNLPLKPLMELTLDKDPEVRGYAALLLGNTKSAEAVEPLLRMFGDNNKDVVEAAETALGRIGTSAYTPLVKCLDNKSASINFAAFKALGRSSDPRAVEILLKPEKHRELVKKVLNDDDYALSYVFISGPDAVEPLLKFFDEPDRNLKIRVVKVLGKIGDEKAIKKLVELSADPDMGIRMEALTGLQDAKEVDISENLIRILKEEKSLKYREEVISIIRQRKDLKFFLPLIELFRDENDEVRSSAKYALQDLLWEYSEHNGDLVVGKPGKLVYASSETQTTMKDKDMEKYEDYLIKMLKDENDNMRSGCADILGYLKSKKAEPYLLVLLRDENPVMRKNAASALIGYKDPTVIQSLIYSLRDHYEEVASQAIDSLNTLDSITAKDIKPLLELTDSPDTNLRQRAIQLLGKTRNPLAINKLVKMLEIAQNIDEEIVIEALGSQRDERAIPVLEKRLNEGDRSIKLCIINSLGQIGGKKSAAILINLFTNESFDREIIYSLEMIGEPARPLLEKALKHKNRRVRDGAAEALYRLDENK